MNKFCWVSNPEMKIWKIFNLLCYQFLVLVYCCIALPSNLLFLNIQCLPLVATSLRHFRFGRYKYPGREKRRLLSIRNKIQGLLRVLYWYDSVCSQLCKWRDNWKNNQECITFLWNACSNSWPIIEPIKPKFE